MGVVHRPRFGRPCFDGCGATVPTQRINLIAGRAERGELVAKSDYVCVDCEKKRGNDATVTRRPRAF